MFLSINLILGVVLRYGLKVWFRLGEGIKSGGQKMGGEVFC